MPKVVHVTTVHRPFDIRIFYKECQTLAAAGYDVTLVAPHERTEIVEGVRIIGLADAKGRLRRATTRAWRAYRIARAERADVYHFHDPELLLFGVLLKLGGNRVVYDVHEDLPQQILTKDWIPSLLRRPLALLSRLCECFGSIVFDGIVAATPTIATRFPRNRTVLVQNFPLLQELEAAALVPYERRPPHAIYVGGMNEKRGLHNMVEAAGWLPPVLRGRLRLAGEIAQQDLHLLKQRPGWTRVDPLGWLSRSGIMAELGQSRIGLVVLHPCVNYLESLPIKLFEYMAAGVPIVASDFPLWRSIIEGAKCGLLVDPLDPMAIASAMQWILEHPSEAAEMGERGKRAARERFSWDSEGTKMTHFYAVRLS